MFKFSISFHSHGCENVRAFGIASVSGLRWKSPVVRDTKTNGQTRGHLYQPCAHFEIKVECTIAKQSGQKTGADNLTKLILFMH